MKNLTSNDLQTLIEYVNKKDDTVKHELTEALTSVSSSIEESVRTRIFNEVKTNPEFRGPTGYTGADGDRGPIGPVGPRGLLPKIDIDEEHVRVRFQIDTALSEATGDEVTVWSEWIDLKGAKGDLGEQGPQGEAGKDGSNGVGFERAVIHEDTLVMYDTLGERHIIGDVRGPQGPQGIPGDKGEPLTWHDLTESQRQMLVGPVGEQGPKGDPGQFPMVECDHEARKIRFQVREDYTDPWGEWIDMPVGPQGEKGDKGDRWMYEDFTPAHLAEITGPMGPQGPQGPKGEKGDRGEMGPQGPKGNTGKRGEKGEKGDKGNPGKDADVKPIQEEVEQFKKKVIGEHEKFDKRLKDTTEKLRGEITNRISDVRFTRLNELLIPTASFNVAGDGSGGEVVQEVKSITNAKSMHNGTPVYIDNQIKASLRGEVYDEDNYLVYAAADHISQVADALAIRGEGNNVYLYRLGTVTIDPEVIADGPDLIPGEYYYLAPPRLGISHGQITVNKPTYGVAQIVGQAISKRQFFVNTTIDPVILNRTELAIQGRNGALLTPPSTSIGQEGDSFGDVIWDDTYLYYCTADYDGLSSIWKRIEINNETW